MALFQKAVFGYTPIRDGCRNAQNRTPAQGHSAECKKCIKEVMLKKAQGEPVLDCKGKGRNGKCVYEYDSASKEAKRARN